jgi:hypothetical protein
MTHLEHHQSTSRDETPVGTAYERCIAALAETNPAVAAAVRAAGCNRSGWPLPGLLGWLPDGDRLDLARAVVLAHRDTELPAGHSKFTDPVEMAVGIVDGAWRSHRYAVRVDEAVLAWSRARGRPDADVLVDFLEVVERRVRGSRTSGL